MDSAAEKGLRPLKENKPKPRKTHKLFKGAWYAGKKSWRGSRSRSRNSFVWDLNKSLVESERRREGLKVSHYYSVS